MTQQAYERVERAVVISVRLREAANLETRRLVDTTGIDA